MTYTLDNYSYDGEEGTGGTSNMAMRLIVHFFNDYNRKKDFPIYAKEYVNAEVNLDLFYNGIKDKGCFVVGSWQSGAHYILVTNIDDNYVYIWDPYYLPFNYYDQKIHDFHDDIELIENEAYNRKVTIKRFSAETKADFALGPIDLRECYYFKRTDK